MQRCVSRKEPPCQANCSIAGLGYGQHCHRGGEIQTHPATVCAAPVRRGRTIQALLDGRRRFQGRASQYPQTVHGRCRPCGVGRRWNAPPMEVLHASGRCTLRLFSRTASTYSEVSDDAVALGVQVVCYFSFVRLVCTTSFFFFCCVCRVWTLGCAAVCLLSSARCGCIQDF